jgi:alpha-beta hydrolase superfamily lysophospholipase
MQNRLPDIACPILILQGDGDQVVDPASATLIKRHATGCSKLDIQMLASDRHGILNEDIDNAVNRVIDFISKTAPTNSTLTAAIPAQ